MNIWAHTLFKNEERYLWYAVMSVINHVDKLLLWDTGSTDNSVKVAEEIEKRYPDKVSFKKVGSVNPEKFTKVRQKMLDETKADWFFIIDGDEVWWDSSIKKLIKTISKQGDKLETVINRTINPVGDIYHYQDESEGEYEFDGRRGFLNNRIINRNIPGLHLDKPHGTQGYYDDEGKLIQERSKKKRLFLDIAYMHFTNLVRSSNRENDLQVPKRGFKLKHELGVPFPKDFYYPEVFFKERPEFVASPWERMSTPFFLRSLIETPARTLKRKIFRSSVGY